MKTPKQAFTELKRAHKRFTEKEAQLQQALAPFIPFDFSINYIYPEGFAIFREDLSLNMALPIALSIIDKHGCVPEDTLKKHSSWWQ